jgi:uncharacterized protein YraI
MMNENNENMNAIELEDIDLELVTGGRTVIHAKRGTLKVYSGPGENHSVIATVDPHDDLVCAGVAKKGSDGKTWIKVRVYGSTGWVRGDKTK